jgi:hypothetical protein
MKKYLLALVAAGLASLQGWATPRPDSGIILTPDNQEQTGVTVYLKKSGCFDDRELFVEIQHPVTRAGDPALAAELILRWGDEQTTLLLYQKLLGKELLITDLCLTPRWLANARLHLIYGGHGSPHNVTIDNFKLWPMEND